MTRAISLFNRYKGDENAITNYIGVLLRLLHDASPQGFAQLWGGWAGLAPAIGPKFLQQTKAGKGIPDLLVEQLPVSIHFEMKLGAAFPGDEIEKRIDDLAVRTGMKILVALGQQEADTFDAEHRTLLAYAQGRSVQVMCVTFESLLNELRAAKRAPQAFYDLVDEFAQFVSEMDLLPKWRSQMTGVSCGETLDEFRNGAYMCPDTGGPYSHQRSRVFGAYSEKAIVMVAEVRGRVVLSPDPDVAPVVSWCDDSRSHVGLIADARKIIAESSPARQEEATQRALQVFVLGDRHLTLYRKRTPGGVPWSKKYFTDLVRLGEAIEDLAERLKVETWAGSEEQ